MEIVELVEDLARALKAADQDKPIGSAGRFKPGVGPLTEAELTTAILTQLRSMNRTTYARCGPLRYPSSRYSCDLVLAGEWALELKLARPFGDNGKPAERWSENLLYPYPGNTSAIGDCLKLLRSGFAERKAVVVIGYEHSPPKIPLEPAIRSFEVIAAEVVGIRLAPRAEQLVTGLIHPSHQQARAYGWEVLGLDPRRELRGSLPLPS
jgi:hypothetical protein